MAIVDNSSRPIILVADDDPDDQEMIRKAVDKNQLLVELHAVADGEQLMDFLHHRGRYAPPALSPRPGIILLDLNMPKMDGREALVEIRADASLRRIPVIVMTTSSAERDVTRAYDLGSSSFIKKPVTLAGLVRVMALLGEYWFQVVSLPAATDGT
jgi:CheY-like chemotaxis protein